MHHQIMRIRPGSLLIRVDIQTPRQTIQLARTHARGVARGEIHLGLHEFEHEGFDGLGVEHAGAHGQRGEKNAAEQIADPCPEPVGGEIGRGGFATEDAEGEDEIAAGEELGAGEDDDGEGAAEADAHEELDDAGIVFGERAADDEDQDDGRADVHAGEHGANQVGKEGAALSFELGGGLLESASMVSEYMP